jgi:hypothetical protein
VLLAVAGTSLAGLAANVPLWLLALALSAVGIGLANTGSLGLLVQAVPVRRIVTAMVVWSQVGILGYLLGRSPAAGRRQPRLRIPWNRLGRRGPPCDGAASHHGPAVTGAPRPREEHSSRQLSAVSRTGQSPIRASQ